MSGIFNLSRAMRKRKLTSQRKTTNSIMLWQPEPQPLGIVIDQLRAIKRQGNKGRTTLEDLPRRVRLRKGIPRHESSGDANANSTGNKGGQQRNRSRRCLERESRCHCGG